MQLKCKWEMVLFGSCAIGFSLKDSDLDLIIQVEDQQLYSLSDFFDILKIKQWVVYSKLIYLAQVPIISLKINLVNSMKLNPKELKKYPSLIINVDISMSEMAKMHEGIENTNYLRQLFDESHSLRTISLIFKELLRKHNLNKPFTGGISSYVLVMMIYGILKQKDVQINENYYKQIQKIGDFLFHEFISFHTLISPFKKSNLKMNSELNLNI